jgi:hypothetical protein
MSVAAMQRPLEGPRHVAILRPCQGHAAGRPRPMLPAIHGGVGTQALPHSDARPNTAGALPAPPAAPPRPAGPPPAQRAGRPPAMAASPEPRQGLTPPGRRPRARHSRAAASRGGQSLLNCLQRRRGSRGGQPSVTRHNAGAYDPMRRRPSLRAET